MNTRTHTHSLGQGGDGGAQGGYYYSGDIPSTSYSLLLGACRLGIEQLVYATLELASMAKISSKEVWACVTVCVCVCVVCVCVCVKYYCVCVCVKYYCVCVCVKY